LHLVLALTRSNFFTAAYIFYIAHKPHGSDVLKFLSLIVDTLTSRGQYSILANHLGIFLKRLCQKRRRNIIELLTVVYEHIYHIIRIAKVVEFFQSALNVFGCKHFLPYLSIDFSLF